MRGKHILAGIALVLCVFALVAAPASASQTNAHAGGQAATLTSTDAAFTTSATPVTLADQTSGTDGSHGAPSTKPGKLVYPYQVEQNTQEPGKLTYPYQVEQKTTEPGKLVYPYQVEQKPAETGELVYPYQVEQNTQEPGKLVYPYQVEQNTQEPGRLASPDIVSVNDNTGRLAYPYEVEVASETPGTLTYPYELTAASSAAIPDGMKEDLQKIKIRHRMAFYDLNVESAKEVLIVFEHYGYDVSDARTILAATVDLRDDLESALVSGDQAAIRSVNEKLVSLWNDFRVELRELVAGNTTDERYRQAIENAAATLERARLIIQELDEEGYDISRLKEIYSEADGDLARAKTALEEGNYDGVKSALQDFYTDMNHFWTTLQTIRNSNTDSAGFTTRARVAAKNGAAASGGAGSGI